MKSKREIVVSALGPEPIKLNPAPQGERAVSMMMDFWREKLNQVSADRPDLINVYEACDRYPFHSMEERYEYYHCRGERMREFFGDYARKQRCYLAYCACRQQADGTWRNQTDLIGRDGETVGVYNKNHLVPGEHRNGPILAGKKVTVLETDFGTVGMAICFDLNFMELLEQYRAEQPDLMLFSSMYHGGLMQRVWAYRCEAYFVGAICGEECDIIDPLGEIVAHSTNYFHQVTAKINLDCKVLHLDGNREKLERAKEAYGRQLTVTEPGHLGCILLASAHPDKDVNTIIQDYHMELWREYYARSLTYRNEPFVREP